MANLFMALYLPANFPCVYIIDRWGLRTGILVGIITMVVGMWVRTLINYDFRFALAGNVIMALGQPLIYNAPAHVTTNWFPEGERPVATMVGT